MVANSKTWQHVKTCRVCQEVKPSNTSPTGHLQLMPVHKPRVMLSLDLMRPFPKSSRGNNFLMVVMVYFTMQGDLFPLRNSRTLRIAETLVNEVFTRWGTHKYIVSDHDCQFMLTGAQRGLQDLGSDKQFHHKLPSTAKLDRECQKNSE